MAHDGYVQVVRTLLAHGAQINEKDANGFTPLHKACVRGSLEAVEILLNHRHPISETGTLEQTPLHLACEGGNAAVVEILLKHDHPVNVKNSFGSTPLHIACDKGSVAMVKMLLAYGARADDKDILARTPLHKACKTGNVDIVKILLQHGARAGGRSGHRYQTPLHRACGSLELVKFLLQTGLSVTDKDRHGEMPLHAACTFGDVEVVKVLLEHGAPVNAVADRSRLTPLHRACEAGNVGVVQVLLENGAHVDALNAQKDTALSSGMTSTSADLVSVLLDYNAGANVMCSCYRCRRRCTVISCQHSLQRQERKTLLVNAYERHFIKSKAAGIQIKGSNMALPLSSVDWSQDNRHAYRLQCLAELGTMKEEKVENTNVSYFNVLRLDLSALRNHKIMNILPPDKLRTKFPIYGNMIHCSYLNLPQRSCLIDQTTGFLDWSDLPRLPTECVLEVLDFLSNEDLRRLVQACKPGPTLDSEETDVKKRRCLIC